MSATTSSLVGAVGMVIVGALAVVYWRRVTRLGMKWFWAGAGLWAVAVALKVICALLTNAAVIGFMKQRLSYWLLVLGGGLFVGVQSSLFEIGLTLLAVFIWRRLGRDADRAIGIGIGAGGFEACLLGITGLIGVIAVIAGVPGADQLGEGIETISAVTPLLWLIAPTERIMAILCHASSRALVLLGATRGRTMMIVWGFIIFTLLDAVAGAAHVSGKIGDISLWWIELAILPFALVSIPVLRWCYVRWPSSSG